MRESLIFQNCVEETSARKRQNGTLSLMYQSQRTREDILKSSIKKCDIDEGNENVIRLD